MDSRDYDDLGAAQRHRFEEPGLGEAILRESMEEEPHASKQGFGASSPFSSPSSFSSTPFSSMGRSSDPFEESTSQSSGFSGFQSSGFDSDSNDFASFSNTKKDDFYSAGGSSFGSESSSASGSPFTSGSSFASAPSSVSGSSSSSANSFGSDNGHFSSTSPFSASVVEREDSDWDAPTTHASASSSIFSDQHSTKNVQGPTGFSSSHASTAPSWGSTVTEGRESPFMGMRPDLAPEQDSDTPIFGSHAFDEAPISSVFSESPAMDEVQAPIETFSPEEEIVSSGLEGIYMPKSWAEHCKTIGELCATHKVLLMTSRPGLGRTCFAHVLQHSPRLGQESLLLSGYHCSDKASLCAEMANQLGVTPSSGQGDELFKILGAAFQQRIIGHEEYNPIVVDDAQYLSEDCLDALAQLVCTGDSPTPFRLILLSDPSFPSRLKKHRLMTSGIALAPLELTPWSRDESKAFLAYYQKVTGQQLFDEKQMNQLAKKTKGVVKSLMEAIHPSTPTEENQDKILISRKHMMSLGGMALGVTLFGIGSYYLFGSTDKISTVAQDMRMGMESTDRFSPQMTPDYEARLPAESSVIDVEDAQRTEDAMSEALAMDAVAPSTTLNDESEAMSSSPQAQAVSPTAPQEAAMIEKELKMAAEVSAPKVHHVEADALFEAVAKKPLSPATKMAKGQFTVQLLSAQNRKNVDSFIKKNHLAGQVEIIDRSSPGKPAFVVVYGGYSDRLKAKEALSKLPPALQQLKPWVRAVESLKSPA